MRKRPDLSKMSTREALEYLFDEQEHKDEYKEQLYEWHSEDNACDDCAQYDGQMFTLAEVPIMHPNCKCRLVATVNGEKVSLSVGEISKQKYEEQKKGTPSDSTKSAKQNLSSTTQSNKKQPPQYWETETDGKKVYDYVVQQEGNITPKEQNSLVNNDSNIRTPVYYC